jgi:GT2 family glycosyltransferase
MMLDLSVIIPFKDKAAMTLECVRSLRQYGPEVREILLVSNNSSAKELDAIRHGTGGMPNVRLVEYDQPFNYQKLNNWAVQQSVGTMLLFLNNDTELIEPSAGLLEYMTQLATRPDVGAVGCTLLYGDRKTIQHGGVYLVSGGLAEHLFVGRQLESVQAACRSGELKPNIVEDVRMSAVTGAVTVMARQKFEQVAGFDERFIICGGDVDLCLRLEQAGFATMYAGARHGHILHKESQSRSHKPVPFNDFYYSYLSYIRGYDFERADRFISMEMLRKK